MLTLPSPPPAPWRRTFQELKAVPFSLTMLLLALALGLTSGMPAEDVTATITTGFGETLGDIALILIPSFILASAVAQSKQARSAAGLATAISPLAGAAMVCPDTAYAALSPVSDGRRLSVLFGVYAGFKLLVPAGPAIVATTLGGLTPTLVGWGAIAALGAWLVGLLYARRHESPGVSHREPVFGGLSPAILVPLAALIILVALGGIANWIEFPMPPVFEYMLNPKGALLIASGLALTFVDQHGRAEAFENGIKRTAPLLLMIGAASALGLMLSDVLAFDQFSRTLMSTGMALPALFILTATFKLAKGSSMATFAGTSGIVSALLPGLGVSVEAATLAMCAGAFVAIAPNDSLYWLVREDAFGSDQAARATRILATGATLQGIAALAIVQSAVWAGFL